MKNCIVLDTFDRFVNFIGMTVPRYRSENRLATLPREKFGPLFFGLLVHLFPAVVFILFVNLSSFSFFGICAAFIGVSTLNLIFIHWAETTDPNVSLPVISLKDRVKGLILVFITASLVGSLFVVGGISLLQLTYSALHTNSWTSILVALTLTDCCYYWTHRSLSHSKKKNALLNWFRNNHIPHHAVKALDFYRGNLSTFIDTAVTSFQLPLILIATCLNMQWQAALVTYFLILLLQSTHHANYTFQIGFLRYVFVDNHSHKMHHCPRGYDVNFGAVFAIWDIFFRTYYEDWKLSPSYLAKHRIPIPYRKIK